ncbi:hypothetical protein [Deinococcus cellulosilyticus]|uniref:Uncharacterized protein n=1 Tax=Deinococcus cellulosilyticus (strain DSM 18568 / NBRC 106333 / KACC 11606 / 5516J-15) TaxID=1223518 RepID=A0A511N7I4_DEIC1|nr:hypothetical protein [Deinococcus cellulosilyticus]GEM48809.1 hypothetical protein DC3_44440 [Deinococcus cellulosilyticus NBRC 106333 = KACC 11606]
MEQERKAPLFEEHPFMYCLWHLEHNYRTYQAFRELADRYREFNPHRMLSADMICHVIRFELGMRNDGDAFHISNNLTSFYARVYRLEHPEANFGLRPTWMNQLTDDQWDEVRDVLRRMKEQHENL